MRKLLFLCLGACSPELAVSVGPGNDGTLTVSWYASHESQLIVSQPDTTTIESFTLPAGCGVVHTNLGNFDGYAVAVLTTEAACAQATTDLSEPLALPVTACDLYDGLSHVGC